MFSPKMTLVLVLLVLLGAVPACSSDLDAGLRAYDAGDYATALKKLRPLAEQGNPRAQRSLGVMYYNGQGVAQDYGEALKWFRRAAEQGDADAQYKLGVMYYDGRGVPQDYAEAVKLFRSAAESGDAPAQSYLGELYESGWGVPQDYVQAHKWYNLAGAGEKPGADRDKAVKNRDLVAAKMTPAQIAEAQRLAREWKAKPEKP